MDSPPPPDGSPILGGAEPGDRLVLRYRLDDGSATDLIGWLQQIEPTVLRVRAKNGDLVDIERDRLIVTKKLAAVARGRDPLRESATFVERIAASGWGHHTEPLGEWLLRAGHGFTKRANSCLAVGDPGLNSEQAARAIISFAQQWGISPLAQAVIGSTQARDLAGQGWHETSSSVQVWVQRLITLVGENPAPDPSVELASVPGDSWVAAFRRSREVAVNDQQLREVLSGTGPQIYAAIRQGNETSAEDGIVAVGKGHVADGWLGIASLWTEPQHRRGGFMRRIVQQLSRWAAGLDARNVYLQVETDNTSALASYQRMGFTHHHDYLYLAPTAVEHLPALSRRALGRSELDQSVSSANGSPRS